MRKVRIHSVSQVELNICPPSRITLTWEVTWFPLVYRATQGRAEVKLVFHLWISEALFYLYIYLIFYLFIFGVFFFFFFLVFPWKTPWVPQHYFLKGMCSQPACPIGLYTVLSSFHAHPALNNCLHVSFIVTSEMRWRTQRFALERINFFITLILTHILFPTCSKKTIQIFPSQDNIFNSFCVFPIFGCFCINRLI